MTMTSFLPSNCMAVICTKSPTRAAGPNFCIASDHCDRSYWPFGISDSGFFDRGI